MLLLHLHRTTHSSGIFFPLWLEDAMAEVLSIEDAMAVSARQITLKRKLLLILSP